MAVLLRKCNMCKIFSNYLFLDMNNLLSVSVPSNIIFKGYSQVGYKIITTLKYHIIEVFFNPIRFTNRLKVIIRKLLPHVYLIYGIYQ